jgi:hypothetical protein
MMTPASKQAAEDRFSPLVNTTALIGAGVVTAMLISLLIALVVNAPAIYRAERRSMDVVLASFHDPVNFAILLPAAVPIVICVVAFVLTIAGGLVLVFTDFAKDLQAEIDRLATVCPTLSFLDRWACNALRRTLIAILWAGLATALILFGIVGINMLVIWIVLL